MTNTHQAAEFRLSIEQKRQAALLYHFTSMEFLEQIIQRVKAWIAFTDTTLDYAARVERDRAMRELGWQEGHLAENWSTHAHPSLVSLLRHLYKCKAWRASEVYELPGVGSTMAGLRHVSMAWTLPEEESKFWELAREAGGPAAKLEAVLIRNIDDYGMTCLWEHYGQQLTPLPKLRVRVDVEAETGRKPPRTGVFVPQDDPFGTLQFGWTGGATTLADSTTLSDLAREYVASVGRQMLWRAPSEALRVPGRVELTDEYFDDWCIREKRLKFDAEVIHASNPRAFIERPCKWYFVERIEGEYEDEPAAPSTPDRLRGEPGAKVPRSGWWYTPAIKGESGFRYFEEGSRFPDTARTEWGAVFWQWDAERQPK